MEPKRYNKILVAKFSPENGCFVQEGATLTVLQKQILSISKARAGYIRHTFVSLLDLKTKSKYGWVKEVPEFTLEDFLGNYPGGYKINDNAIGHATKMLSSINNLNGGTPVTVNYSIVGIIEREIVLSVHKVFFYNKI